MEPAVVWNLYYSLATRDEQQICRLHFNSLRQDPHVETLAIGQGLTNFIAEVTVTFKQGHDQPKNRDLQALNLRYPPITVTEISDSPDIPPWPVARPLLPPDERLPFLPTSQETRMMTASYSMTFDTETQESQFISAEYSPMFEPIPAWVRVNIWVRNKIHGNRYQVIRLILSDPSSIILHEWRTIPDLLLGVAVSYLVSDFEECEEPVEGDPAFERLLNDEDPFEG